MLTADFRAIHHRQLEMVPDPEQWIDAHVKLADKWDGRMGIGTGAGSWKDRALRAEADTEAALILAHMNSLESDARVRDLRARARRRRPRASRGGSPRRCGGCTRPPLGAVPSSPRAA